MSDLFFISAYSIGVALDALIFTLIVAYLYSIPSPKASTRYLALALLGVNAAFLMLTVNFSSINPTLSQIAWILLHLAIFGIHGFVMFGYEFLQNVHEKESRIVGKISLVASIFGFLYYAAATFWTPSVYIFGGELYYYDIAVPGIIIGIQFGWMFVTLFRKAAYFSNKEARGIRQVLTYALRGKDDRSIVIRQFMTGFVWVLPFEFFILFATLGWISWVIAAYMTALGVLALTTWLVLFYFKHSGEQNTFLIKQVGLFLLSTSTIIGIIGVITVEEQKHVYHDLRQKELLQFAKNPLDSSIYPQTLGAIYKIGEKPVKIWEKKGFNAPNLPESPNTIGNEPLFIKGDDKNPASFFIAYGVVVKNDKYLLAYPFADYRAWLAKTARKVMLALLLAVLLAVFLFPPILRRSILRPLNMLLDGVRRVNAGESEVCVTVETNDEIGYLTKSFNSMVVTISQARDELKRHADDLEGLVEERTSELREAKEQTDRIFANIEEGLFLLFYSSGKFLTGSQYSRALSKILRTERIAKRDFTEILSPLLPDRVVADLLKYLRLMFRANMSEEMLAGLNPLENIEVCFDEEVRHLRFSFVRIFKDNEITHLMGRVNDVTDEVRLANELERSKNQNRRQTDILITLLNCDSLLLNDFMRSAESDYAEAYGVLSDENTPASQKTEALYRHIHSIKGNASMLKLGFIADLAHECEEKLAKLKTKSVVSKAALSGEEFVRVSTDIYALGETLSQTRMLIEKITLFAAREENGSIERSLVDALSNLLTSVATGLGKSATIDSSEFSLSHLAPNEQTLVKDVLVQLIRNSAYHGIEAPETRAARGKNPIGKVTLKTLTTNGKVTIVLEDDGGGLNIEAIREKAVKFGLMRDEDILSENEIANFIFESGLSTAQSASMAAGRGVGMDLVRSKLRKAGGDITVSFEPGRWSRFEIFIPGAK